MVLLSDGAKIKACTNTNTQIENFINWINTLTGIVNTFGDYKTTYTDTEDQDFIDTRLNQAKTLVTNLSNLIDAKLAL